MELACHLVWYARNTVCIVPTAVIYGSIVFAVCWVRWRSPWRQR